MEVSVAGAIFGLRGALAGPMRWGMGRDYDEIRSQDPEHTRAAGARLAAGLGPGAVVALYGDLGSGKTVFVQGMARSLGVMTLPRSPTFSLVNEYSGRLPLYHVDLYRVRDAREALASGLGEYLEQDDGITVVEWAERIEDLLPGDVVRVRFSAGAGENERIMTIETGPRNGGSRAENSGD